MMTLLETYAQQPPERPWSEAVADFRAAEARVRTIRDARTRVYRDVQQRDRLVSTLDNRKQALSVATAQATAAKEGTGRCRAHGGRRSGRG